MACSDVSSAALSRQQEYCFKHGRAAASTFSHQAKCTVWPCKPMDADAPIVSRRAAQSGRQAGGRQGLLLQDIAGRHCARRLHSCRQSTCRCDRKATKYFSVKAKCLDLSIQRPSEASLVCLQANLRFEARSQQAMASSAVLQAIEAQATKDGTNG